MTIQRVTGEVQTIMCGQLGGLLLDVVERGSLRNSSLRLVLAADSPAKTMLSHASMRQLRVDLVTAHRVGAYGRDNRP